jgi:hypothetical protein
MPAVDGSKVRRRIGIGMRVIMLIGAALSLWVQGRFVAREIGYAPTRLDRVVQTSLREREQAALEEHVPGLIDAAELVAPIFIGAGHLEVPLVVLTPGGWEAAPAAGIAHSILGYHFAPAARMAGMPVGVFEQWLRGSGPGEPNPDLLAHLRGAVVILVVGVPETKVGELVELATAQFGAPVLHRGVSREGRHHVLLIGDLPERIARGEPESQRYRELLR